MVPVGVLVALKSVITAVPLLLACNALFDLVKLTLGVVFKVNGTLEAVGVPSAVSVIVCAPVFEKVPDPLKITPVGSIAKNTLAGKAVIL